MGTSKPLFNAIIIRRADGCTLTEQEKTEQLVLKIYQCGTKYELDYYNEVAAYKKLSDSHIEGHFSEMRDDGEH